MSKQLFALCLLGLLAVASAQQLQPVPRNIANEDADNNSGKSSPPTKTTAKSGGAKKLSPKYTVVPVYDDSVAAPVAEEQQEEVQQQQQEENVQQVQQQSVVSDQEEIAEGANGATSDEVLPANTAFVAEAAEPRKTADAPSKRTVTPKNTIVPVYDDSVPDAATETEEQEELQQEIQQNPESATEEVVSADSSGNQEEIVQVTAVPAATDYPSFIDAEPRPAVVKGAKTPKTTGKNTGKKTLVPVYDAPTTITDQDIEDATAKKDASVEIQDCHPVCKDESSAASEQQQVEETEEEAQPEYQRDVVREDVVKPHTADASGQQQQ